jgi:hypothetical protein
MATSTVFVALPFRRTASGNLSSDVAQELPCATTAVEAAQRLADRNAGAVAFSRTLDLRSGESRGAQLLQRFGETPPLDYLL